MQTDTNKTIDADEISLVGKRHSIKRSQFNSQEILPESLEEIDDRRFNENPYDSIVSKGSNV